MQIGDLVKHEHLIALGIVLKTPTQTHNGDYLVRFIQRCRDITLYCSHRRLELLNASR
jgi:hypothetical protein